MLTEEQTAELWALVNSGDVPAVDAPHRPVDAVPAEGAEPRQGVLVVGVHESAVDVEDRGVCHGR
jgi:hypothetical protein